MKRITVTALFTLAALVTAGDALAQGRAVRATVPFDGTIEVRDRDKHVTMLMTTTYNSHESRNSTLVFDKYGDQYFLSEILCRSAAMNMSVHPSKAEQHARMQQAALHNASQVYVAAK